MESKLRVFVAKELDMVKGMSFAGTVEAEYGDHCVQGEKVTLAHHGSRANNPAPCCAEVQPLADGDTILVSHIDLDTVGGCAALMGCKPECDEFWQAAAYVDVHGKHNMHKLSERQQDMLNAYDAWAPRQFFNEFTDVTEIILSHVEFIERIVSDEEELLENGRQWKAKNTRAMEERLYRETGHVRAFVTDGLPCGAAYYNPESGKVFQATVQKNTKFGAVTVAFADEGKRFSACELVQSLWGASAGGSRGIGGSPRGWKKTPEELQEEFEKAIKAVEELYCSLPQVAC